VLGAYGAVVVDRIVAVVGKQPIKASDVELDMRVTQFLNQAPFVLTLEEIRGCTERLIDQELIRQEIITGGFQRPTEAEAAELEAAFVRDHFGGSQARLQEALKRYGLTTEQLQAKLLWQLTVLRFIDERFRDGVSLSEEDVRSYYDQHIEELRRQHPKRASFEDLEKEIRTLLEGER